MRTGLLGAVCLQLVVGCGHGSGNLDQACADFANANCIALDACEKDGVSRLYGDMPTCLTRVKTSCLIQLGAPSTGSSPATREACAASYPTASCHDFIYPPGIPACSGITGSLADGSPCIYGAQCTSGFCVTFSGAVCGTCYPKSQEGGICPCFGTYVCTSSGCKAGGGSVASCSTMAPCLPGFSCVGGTCKALSTHAGDPCPCDSFQELFCVNGQCAAQATATSGQQCGNVNGVLTTCIKASSCVGASGTTTCQPLPLEGQPCLPNSSCLSPARCVAGTCQLPDPSKCH